MSDMPSLQFDRVEHQPGATAQSSCKSCSKRIVQSYYEANGQIICSDCRQTITESGSGSRFGRIGRAFAAGFGAALLGAILWYGVRKITGYEVGIISIAIGVAVGRAVRWGSRNRGGWAYQLIAILLTYTSVAGNYMPDVFQVMMKSNDEVETSAAPAAATQAPAAKPKVVAASTVPAANAMPPVLAVLAFLLIAFGIAAAAPFMAGAENIIGLLIIAFGLFEAWKLNKRVEIAMTGPFSVTPVTDAPPANA